MQKLKYITLITILLSFSVLTHAQEDARQPETQSADSRTEQKKEKTYQELLNELVPKQEDFIQNSKNLDVNNNQKVDENEKKAIQFTEGDVETQVIPRIIKFIIYASFLIFTGIFIYAGALLATSQGNENTYTEIKNLIVNTLIGVGFILAAYAIVVGVIGILTNLKTF